MQTSTTKPPIWKRAFPLLSAHFVNDFFGNVLPVLAPLLAVQFDLSLAMVGVISTAHTGATSGIQLVFGVLGDRLRKINFVLWGPILSGVFLSVSGLMPNVPLLIVSVVIAGLGSAMFHPQGTATAGGLSKTRRGTMLSLFIASGRVGAATAPVIAGYLFGELGLVVGSFAMLGFAALFGAGLTFTIPKPEPQPQNQREPLWQVFVPLIPMWLMVVLRHIPFMSFSTYLMFYLEARGFTLADAAAQGLFLFMLGGALGVLIGGPLSDSMGRKPLIVLTFMLTPPCFFAFMHTEGVVSLVWLFVSGMLLLSNNPMVVALAQERVPNHASTASAVTMGFGWLGGTAFVAPVGALADHIGIEAALGWVIWTPILSGLLALFAISAKR